MAQHGSPGFQSYSRNLRRLFWVEFIDAQMAAAEASAAKASLDPEAHARRSMPVAPVDRRRLLAATSAD